MFNVHSTEKNYSKDFEYLSTALSVACDLARENKAKYTVYDVTDPSRTAVRVATSHKEYWMRG